MLTETKVRNTKHTTKTAKLSNGGGLYLLVTPAGSKSWRWKYRFDGKEKKMTFGPYPEVSLASARDKHFEARQLLAEGTDPMAERREVKTATESETLNTFAAVGRKWYEHWQVGITECIGDLA
jgi:hypothetical protein